jgi:hypothetical protein
MVPGTGKADILHYLLRNTLVNYSELLFISSSELQFILIKPAVGTR